VTALGSRPSPRPEPGAVAMTFGRAPGPGDRDGPINRGLRRTSGSRTVPLHDPLPRRGRGGGTAAHARTKPSDGADEAGAARIDPELAAEVRRMRVDTDLGAAEDRQGDVEHHHVRTKAVCRVHAGLAVSSELDRDALWQQRSDDAAPAA